MVQVGRLVPLKNHAFLFEVIACAQSEGIRCKMIVVGDGPDRSKLEQRATELGIAQSVLFLGLRADVSAILSASDVFAMPSHYEGLPLAAVEAQASGLPTLLSSNVAREAALSDFAKFLPIDEDVGAWCDELQSLSKGSECREAERQKAVEVVQHAGFDIGMTIDQLSSIYMEIVRSER